MRGQIQGKDMDPKRHEHMSTNEYYIHETDIHSSLDQCICICIRTHVHTVCPLAWWEGGREGRNGGKACVCWCVASEIDFQPVESNTGAYLKSVRACDRSEKMICEAPQ